MKMTYEKPEIKIIELRCLDIIATGEIFSSDEVDELMNLESDNS